MKPADAERLIQFTRANGEAVSAVLETKVPSATLAFRLAAIDVSSGSADVKVRIGAELGAVAHGCASLPRGRSRSGNDSRQRRSVLYCRSGRSARIVSAASPQRFTSVG